MQSKTGQVPGVTFEIGRSACPIPVSKFPDIWEKNKQVWAQPMDFEIKN
jgi:g-D-glutamyl-meso-diaminopimelate peptidase